MDTNYQYLANAIIIQAVKDYKIALQKGFVDDVVRGNQKLYDGINTLETFFRSTYYGLLTGVDSEILIQIVKAQVENELKVNISIRSV